MTGSWAPWENGAAPASWAEVSWPDWVPLKVRAEIESFWSASYARGPKDYERSAGGRYNGGGGLIRNIPMFGEELTLPGWSPGEIVTGRWVHAWNNIGRVIAADGTVQYASTCSYRRAEE